MSPVLLRTSPLTMAVGTESKQKLRYLEEVLQELGGVAEITPFKARSGVSDQPITSDETVTGACNRAKAALEAISGATYGMSTEYTLLTEVNLYEGTCI